MGSINPKDSWIKASPTYQVPNITLNDPANRKMKVITIGAGYSGVRSLLHLPDIQSLTLRQIMMAYKISQECHNVEHVIYEKNPEIGGTYVFPSAFQNS